MRTVSIWMVLFAAAPLLQAAEPLVLAREGLDHPRVPGEIVIDVDHRVRQQIVETGRGVVRDFPLPGKAVVDLELEAFNLLAPQARFVVVDGSGSREMPPPPIRAFRGKVRGDPDSLVSLIFLGDRMAGFIRTWNDEFSVGPQSFNPARPGASETRVRRRQDPPGGVPFRCGGALEAGADTLVSRPDGSVDSGSSTFGLANLDRLPSGSAPQPVTAVDGSTLLQASIAIDATVEFYQHIGSLTATQDYILNLMAQVSTIYEHELLIKIEVGYLRVFAAEPDPYTDGSTDTSVLLADLRSEWMANQSGVQRTAAHLFSRRTGGGSGLAYVDVLCNHSYGYGVSTFPGDGGSWEKDLTAHELGHNFSSPHTHCFTPEIDTCANQDGCYQGATQQTVGTIMSYCSQSQSTFHQRVRDEKIRPAAEAAYPACITTAGLPGDVESGPGGGLVLSKPPVCPTATLSNDDGSLNGYYGYGGTTRMAWIKRFTPACYPFRLTDVEVMIGHSSIAPGRPIRLLVYSDPAGSGDPGNATLVHSEDTTVQLVSSASWNRYPLVSGVMIDSGDYYLGVYDLEADAPDSYIASRDGSREGDSWQTAESTSPDDFGLHGGATWMIRGSGGSVPAGTIRLAWQPPCNEATTPDQDYAVYSGAIGDFANLSGMTCSTSRATSTLMEGVQDGSFLIVVPRTSANEGSYGRGGDGLERAPAAAACRPQEIDSCL